MYTFGISGMLTFGLRQLAQNQADVASSAEKLATGKRINRASDDPSGMIAAENHKVEIYSLNKQLDAFAQKEGFLGAKEGGLSVLSDLMIQLESVVVQAANKGGTTQAEQDGYRVEISSILKGIDHIASTTTFKGRSVMQEYTTQNLDGDLGSLAELVGSDPQKAQEVVRAANENISTTRAAIGTSLKEIDHQRGAIGEQLINLNASLSSIEDTDYAAEAARLVRSQILEQASIASISISRQSAGQVLGLLKSAAEINATS